MPSVQIPCRRTFCSLEGFRLRQSHLRPVSALPDAAFSHAWGCLPQFLFKSGALFRRSRFCIHTPFHPAPQTLSNRCPRAPSSAAYPVLMSQLRGRAGPSPPLDRSSEVPARGTPGHPWRTCCSHLSRCTVLPVLCHGF